MKHTPKPWEQFGTIIWSKGHGVVCELSEIRPTSGLVWHEALAIGSPDWEEGMANARLIIVAPEMYEALAVRIAYENRDPPPFGHDCQWCRDCYNRLLIMERAALAKAGGET